MTIPGKAGTFLDGAGGHRQAATEKAKGNTGAFFRKALALSHKPARMLPSSVTTRGFPNIFRQYSSSR